MTKNNLKNGHHKQGFTLVELAIVLVVIGLLLGMAFKGKSLVDAARLKSDINKMTKISTAINIFYAKYDKLPGMKSDYSFINKDMYDDLIKEGLLVESDFAVTLKDDNRPIYWAFTGCTHMNTNGVTYWGINQKLDENVCIFRTYGRPQDFTMPVTLTQTAFGGAAVCNIESMFDDKTLHSGSGRLITIAGTTGVPTINTNDVSSQWDCSDKASNRGTNIPYAISVL